MDTVSIKKTPNLWKNCNWQIIKATAALAEVTCLQVLKRQSRQVQTALCLSAPSSQPGQMNGPDG